MVACSGCSGTATQTTLVRGQLDRKDWTLTVCNSNERVRVVMPSTVAFHFGEYERDLALADSDSVLVEFYVTPISSTSSRIRTVGVMKVVSVKRGIYADAA